MQRDSSSSFVLLLATILIVGVGCAEAPPEERLAMTRARYEASLNGFLVEQQPMQLPESADPDAAEEPAVEGDETGQEAVATEPGGEAESVEEAPVALLQNVLLDIVIRHESFDKLDGITVDITMADGERELQVWQAWFDTSAIEKGPGVQFSHTLENVDYQPGYGFSADIRHPVPPEEWGRYKEFSDLGG